MRAALIIMGTAGVGWLVFSVLTISVVRDSLRRQGRRFSIGDLAAIAAGPLFWLECLIEMTTTDSLATPVIDGEPIWIGVDYSTGPDQTATWEFRDGVPTLISDPVKPDYQPGDEIAVFPPFNRNEVA